jgi:hypothetical protein
VICGGVEPSATRALPLTQQRRYSSVAAGEWAVIAANGRRAASPGSGSQPASRQAAQSSHR